jgi:uncharacterized protein
MRDGRFLCAVKWVARARFWLDLTAVRALQRRRGRPGFDLGGECRRCARCCEAPGIQANVWVWHLPRVRSLFLWWQRVVNGFELVRAERAERLFVFRCTHFDPATRRCDSYGSRPGICRDYPRALLHQPQPELLPGCGYRAVARHGRRFLTVLEQYPLTPEQRERLKRDLNLE